MTLIPMGIGLMIWLNKWFCSKESESDEFMKYEMLSTLLLQVNDTWMYARQEMIPSQKL